MPATVYVVVSFRAHEGKEQALKQALTALVAPTRRELGCYQYDLLQSPTDPRAFCFVERWESQAALDQHLESEHVKKTMADISELAAERQGNRYTLV